MIATVESLGWVLGIPVHKVTHNQYAAIGQLVNRTIGQSRRPILFNSDLQIRKSFRLAGSYLAGHPTCFSVPKTFQGMTTRQMKVTLASSENGLETSDQRPSEPARSARAVPKHDWFLIKKMRAIRMDMWTPSIHRRLEQLVERLSH